MIVTLPAAMIVTLPAAMIVTLPAAIPTQSARIPINNVYPDPYYGSGYTSFIVGNRALCVGIAAGRVTIIAAGRVTIIDCLYFGT
jgi:hypothetical protein